MVTIEKFSGKYRWLSNFYPSIVTVEWLNKTYTAPTVEHGYQASKCMNKEDFVAILKIPVDKPGQAKRYTHKVSFVERSRWKELNLSIMKNLISQKFNFAMNPELASKLVNTGSLYLIEGNYWHDNFYGICKCSSCPHTGENWLGNLLMERRSELNELIS